MKAIFYRGRMWGWMLLLIPFASIAQTVAVGLPDDGQVRLPQNYNSFVLPPVGETFWDAAFATKIYRVTDGLTQFNDAIHHEYSTMTPFNKDNTMMLLLSDKNGFFVTDRFGQVIWDTDAVGIGGRNEPRWSPRSYDLFYFHDGNRLMVFDVTSGTRRVIRTFDQFNVIGFGGGESDISEDGDHVVILGDNRYVGVYKFSADSLGRTLDVSGAGDFDYFDMTANNNVIVRWGSEGTARYQGFEVFDQNMNFIRQVIPFSGHADRTHDTNDDEVLLVQSSNDPNPLPGCEYNGIEKIRLSDSKKSCILSLNHYTEMHISANRFRNNLNPWVLVSVTDVQHNTAAPIAAMASDWEQKWGHLYNELLMVKLDGSEVRRIAHHRSRTLDNYWFAPRASISRDGAFAAFDSNFGAQPFNYYTDVFWINLTGNSYEVESVSAASYNGKTLARASLASGFGPELTKTTQVAPAPVNSLSGTRVYVRDSAGKEHMALLLFVSPQQVNFQVPSDVALGAASVTVIGPDGSASMGKVQIADVQPGLFTVDATGRGLAAATVQRVRADGSSSYEQVTRFDAVQNRIVAIPIDLGATTEQVYLNLYATGVRHRSSLSAVTVTVGGVSADVVYAGQQPDYLGLDQLNVLIPRSLAGRGEVDIVVRVDGQTANTVKVNIQ